MQSHCLNCSEEITKKFCANCGQKTDTHRITLKHFLFHDLLHGVWHIDKGILFTIKQTMLRPGRAGLDYINGKRQPYYNIFYLSLLVLGINVLFSHYINSLYPEPFVDSEGGKIDRFIALYAKFFIFGAVPVLAFNTLTLFRRLKLNFAEHVIINGFTILGILLLNLIYSSFFFAYVAFRNGFFNFFFIITTILILLYPAYVIFDATRKTYGFWAFLLRIFMFYVFVFVEVFILVLLVGYLLIGKLII